MPGCDPYREYLFSFMRQQPIWHSLRFWNAAFYDAVQKERDHRMSLRIKKAEKRLRAKEELAAAKINNEDTNKDDEESSSSSHHSKALEEQQKSKDPDVEKEHQHELKLQENIIFKQLG